MLKKEHIIFLKENKMIPTPTPSFPIPVQITGLHMLCIVVIIFIIILIPVVAYAMVKSGGILDDLMGLE